MIFISSSAVKSMDTGYSIDELVRAGFRNIELSGGTTFAGDPSNMLMSYRQRYSLNFIVHNYFPPPEDDFVLNIASTNEGVRRRSVEFVKASVDLAARLGSRLYTVHAGYTTDMSPGADGRFIVDRHSRTWSGEAGRIMLDSMAEIERYAAGCNVRIGVENLFPVEDAPNASLMCTPSQIFEFLDSDIGKKTGLLLDLAHLEISSNLLGFDRDGLIDALGLRYRDSIVGLHLSGNDGQSDLHDVLLPGSWQLEAAASLWSAELPLTVECRAVGGDKAFEQYRMVKDCLERSA